MDERLRCLAASGRRPFRNLAIYRSDSGEAADRVQSEFYEMFSSLAQTPGQGHSREDLTRRHVLFFPLYSYLIVYQPDVDPIRIVAVVHGWRDVKCVLKQREL